MSDQLTTLSWQNMSFELDSHQHYPQHLHYPQPSFQNQLTQQPPPPPPPPPPPYEFQVPINLFSNHPTTTTFSPGSSSSNSSNQSTLFNNQPTPYLTSSLQLTQSLSSKALDRTSLLGCQSRDSRSGSVSSEPNSNWQVHQSFDIPTDSFQLLPWAGGGGGEESHWEMPRFEDQRAHERSRSEGDIIPASPFQPAQSLEPSFDLNPRAGPSDDYRHDGNQTEMNGSGRRWLAEEQEAEDDKGSFDPTRSKFVLDSLPTSDHHHHKINNPLQPIRSVTTEGPVMASFALPPDNQHHRTIPSRHGSTHKLTSNHPPLSPNDLSNLKPTTTAKKTPNGNPRTGNNGGRCRRLAPANRECPHCGAKFTRNDRLNYHIDSIHEHKEPKFKCDIGNCSRAFRQRSDLVRHSRHVHHKI